MTNKFLAVDVDNLPETVKAALEKEGVLTDRPLTIVDLTEMPNNEVLAFFKRTEVVDYLLDMAHKDADRPKVPGGKPHEAAK